MKRLLIFAALLGLFSAAPAFAQGTPASATAGASANIVGVIGITKLQDMSFGNIVSPAAATNVIMAADGTLDPSGITVPGGSKGQPAIFDVTGSSSNAYTYKASLGSSSIDLLNGNASMPLDLVIQGASTGRIGLQGDGTDQVIVTGTLHVGQGQALGTYTGTMSVTVQYD